MSASSELIKVVEVEIDNPNNQTLCFKNHELVVDQQSKSERLAQLQQQLNTAKCQLDDMQTQARAERELSEMQALHNNRMVHEVTAVVLLVASLLLGGEVLMNLRILAVVVAAIDRLLLVIPERRIVQRGMDVMLRRGVLGICGVADVGRL